jgi:serine/threonine-protein kinase HipA
MMPRVREHYASLKLALEAAIFFSLSKVEARQRARAMAQQLEGIWKHHMRDRGVTGAELRALEPAFEHAEMEQALAL